MSDSKRTTSIDLLRGVIMVIMALDHTRDYFGQTPYAPTDLTKTNLALFFTRWITHFCAPNFVFLAGTAAWLSRARKTDADLTRFLVSRGLWLVFLEATLNTFCWSFDVTWPSITLQVIWAIGISMIVLAAFVRLPAKAIAAVGAVIVFGHDLLDRVHLGVGTPWHPLWAIVHEQDSATILGEQVRIFYPLVPWVGVMMLGFAFGSIFSAERGVMRSVEARTRDTLRIGLAATLGFLVVRASNLYGDPEPWSSNGAAWTLESFLNCEKYPPSLCYLLMTLGPALLVLAAFDRSGVGDRNPVAKAFVVYGRVPLFYYVLHITLIHAAAVLTVYARTGKLRWVTQWWGPDALNVGLPLTFLTWALVVSALYPACKWFAGVKASEWGRQRAWLSYL